MAKDISSALSPLAMAVAISPIISVALGHIICAPTMVLEYASNTRRINPFSPPVTHGKIYEASASTMFGVPIEKIRKGNPEYALRSKGKVAELALGYQGAAGALIHPLRPAFPKPFC